MDIFRKMTVWELLNFLKSRVKENVDQINKNISDLKECKKSSSDDEELQSQINNANSEISKLTAENNHYLSIFNELLKLHNNLFVSEEMSKKETKAPVHELSDDYVEECIIKTISGEIPITEQHPLLSEADAYNSLMESLMENEMYEKCAELIQLKESDKQHH